MSELAPTLFAFPCDWSEPPERTQTWPTDVLTHDDGTEQRALVAATPVTQLAFTVTTRTPAEKTRLRAALAAAASLRYTVPVWCDQTTLDADVAAGDTVIPCDTTDRAFVAGAQALLTRGLDDTELVTIDSVAADGLTLSAPTENAWPAGRNVLVVPVVTARLVTPAPVGTRGQRHASVRLTWDVELPTAGAGASGGTETAMVPAAISWALLDGSGRTPSVKAGGHLLVEATVTDAAGVVIPDAAVTWSVSRADGLAVAPAGPYGRQARVTGLAYFSDNSLTASCGALSDTGAVVVG